MDQALLAFILSRYLYKEDVQDLLDELGQPITGSKDEIVLRLIRSRGFDPGDALSFLRRDDLEEICEEIGLAGEGSRATLLRRVEAAIFS
jgi:hypothetical protein